MKGLELLKEELKKRGVNPNTVNSKIVPTMLSILAEDDRWMQLIDIESEIQGALIRLRNIERDIDREKTKLEVAEERYNELTGKVNSKEKETYEYIEAFTKALENCETAEGRDKMREAQVFINTANVVTKYDNTTFIAGLATVMTGGKFNGMEKLKQVNPKLFAPSQPKKSVDDEADDEYEKFFN